MDEVGPGNRRHPDQPGDQGDAVAPRQAIFGHGGVRGGSANHAVLVHVQDVELSVTAVEVKRDLAARFRRARAHLGYRVFEAIGEVDSCAVLAAGLGVDDRSPRGFDDVGHLQTRLTGVHIDVDFDRGIEGLETSDIVLL